MTARCTFTFAFLERKNVYNFFSKSELRKRCFLLDLFFLFKGSNLGTTTTSLLASFAAGGHHVKAANQIALVHMFFNLTGICIFYPVPCMRLPVRIARVLGTTTATYRWFAVVYLAFMFFIFPSTMFLLSLAGPVPLYCFLGKGQLQSIVYCIQ